MTNGQTTVVAAHAKINLTLAVLGKRPDGYHDLSSVMQTISLHDSLDITATTDGRLHFTCGIPGLSGSRNLAYRAADLLRADAGDPSLGATLALHKVVPTQGGLGGGSSDAAYVLAALNTLWGLHLPDERLEALGARLGSDVPFFIRGGTCLIAGRGEVVTPLPDARPFWLVLAKPPVAISTAAVFRTLSPADYASPEHSEAIVGAIRAGDVLPAEHLVNSLEAGVLRAYPAVAATRDALLAAGAPVVRMSGSGPSLYAPFADRAEASAVTERATSAGVTAWLCRTVSHAEVLAARPQAAVLRS